MPQGNHQKHGFPEKPLSGASAATRTRMAVRLSFWILTTFVLATLAPADESRSWWNPLGLGTSDRTEQKTVSGRSSAPKNRSSSTSSSLLPKPALPKIHMPGTGARHEAASKKPSTWDKVNSGTKSFFSKTKSVLMPWSHDSDSPSRTKNVGDSRRNAYAPAKPKQTEKSSFSSWFGPDKEEEKVESVNDFLKLPTTYQ
jgi:hypothetical protein